MAKAPYDCLIVGSGLFGSAAALVLRRSGLRVLVVEAKRHPRFAIGESMVPTTTRGLEWLARTYDVPELRAVSHYLGLRELDCAGWPKQAFWFGYSRPGQAMQWSDQLMYISPGLPQGPDVHVLRADTDAYLVSCFPAYGVEYRDQTVLDRLTLESEGVAAKLTSHAGVETVRARYLLDCTGYASAIARQLGLRDPSPTCRTNTRTIFSHFRNVPMLEDVLGHTEPLMVNSRDVTTIHHCFERGWIWVIRFDSGVVSVGVTLDRSVHPEDNRPGEDEFWDIVSRYPTVQAHLGAATPIRPFVKTGRLQYTSHGCVADHVALAPHAATFLDPLLSTGMNLSQAFLSRFVPRLTDGLAARDLSVGRFRDVATAFELEVDAADMIIDGMFRSFADFDLFKQYWRTWVYASITQYLTQASTDPAGPPLALYGGSLAGWRAVLKRMYEAVAEGGADPITTARRLKAIMDEVDEPFDLRWEIGASGPMVTPVSPRPRWFERLVRSEPALCEWRGSPAGEPSPRSHEGRDVLRGFRQFWERTTEAGRELQARYDESRRLRTAFHKDVDFIRANQYYAKDRPARKR